MTAKTLYGSNIANGTLTDACTMSDTTGGNEVALTACDWTGAHPLGEMTAQGGGPLAGVDAIPAVPTGHGWCYQPGEGTFALGYWAASIALSDPVNGPCTPRCITLRLFRYCAGNYHPIGTIPLEGATVATTRAALTFPNAYLAPMAFGASDWLYIDMWYHSDSAVTDDTPVVYVSDSATQGVADNMQITTSDFTANPLTVYCPAVPSFGTPYTNAYGVACTVYISPDPETGGSAQSVAVNGIDTGLLNGVPTATVRVPSTHTITLYGSGDPPRWTWFGE